MRKLIFTVSIVFGTLCPVKISAQHSVQSGIPKAYITLHDNKQIGAITKDEKILADMRIENANGSDFLPTQLFDNWIRIKGRGNSSWNSEEAEKKSYSIDLVNNEDRRVNVPLLGMPSESNFILYASYFDKTLLKNYFSYHLATAMGHWASRSRFVELYINGDYRGLYVVGENIREGAGRMDVKAGGFILEQDYPQRLINEGADFITNSRKYPGRYYYKDPIVDNLYFSFRYPADGDRTEEQTNYMRDYIAAFETALHGDNFKDPNEGYSKYIDVNSFVDWYIISELGGDWDHCYFLSSCYISKPEGEKMKLMPVWDFDVGYKVAVNYLSARRHVPWISRLWEDEAFRKLVFERYEKIIPLLDDAISHIEDVAEQLNNYGAIDRNFARWDILGKHIWTEATDFIPKTYAGEIRRLTQWIRQRFLHMATYDNNVNYCEIIKNMKPAIRIINQDLYDEGSLPMQVTTSIFNLSEVNPTYIWNNVSGNNTHTINSYGEHSLTIQLGTCVSLPAEILHVKQLATITISNNSHNYDGTPKTVTVTTVPSSLPATLTFNGKSEVPYEPGEYRVIAEINDSDYKGRAVSTMTITLADPTLIDATLSSLSVSSGALSPAFSANVTEYSVNTANSVTSINVAAAASQVGASIAGNGNHSLIPGINIITVIVTAKDGVTTKNYTIRVNRASITNVAVSPVNPTVQKGNTQQFAANLTFEGNDAVYRNLVLNEISGEHKYVEIFNSGDEPVNLEGVRLQRNNGPTAGGSEWVGTNTDIIPEKAYRLILFRDYTPADLADKDEFVGWQVSSGISDQQILKVAIVDPLGTEVSVFIRGDEPLPAWQQWPSGSIRNRAHSYSRMSDGTWAYALPTPGEINGNREGSIVTPGYLTGNDVTWELTGATSISTTINAGNGLLTVAENETAVTLTVRATSTVDNSKFGATSVNVIAGPTLPEPEINIAVSPVTSTVQRGATQRFSARTIYDEAAAYDNLILTEVSGEHKYVEIYNTGSVSISLNGVRIQRNDGILAGGSEWIGTDANNIPAGAYRLILFRDYTPADLIANPAFDGWQVSSGISDQQILKVAIVDPSGNEVSVFIRGDEPLPAWQQWPSGSIRNRLHSYSRMNDGTWAYALPTPGVANGDKEGEILNPGYLTSRNIIWTVVGATSAATTINASGFLTVAANETASTLTVRATSTIDDTKSATASVSVGVPNINVAVSPPESTVQQGARQQFSAKIIYQDAGHYNNLVLNEISGNQKFVEIRNVGNAAINLQGVRLQRNDGPASGGSEWVGSETDIIPAGAYRLFLFNDYAEGLNTNPAHTGWIVSSGISDRQILKVAIIDPSGNPVDVFIRGNEPLPSWGQWSDNSIQNEQHSYSRMIDGSWAYASPTPGVVNANKAGEILSPGYLTSRGITWIVSGAASNATTINASGILTVAVSETAEKVIVRATSTVDAGKWSEAEITIEKVEQPVLPSDDATLKSITVSSGALTPTFDSQVTEYTVNVEHTVWSISLGATPNHEKATIENGDNVLRILNYGDNRVDFTVKAEDGTTTKTYTVNIIRANVPVLLSDDATLKFLIVDRGDFSSEFSPEVTEYTVNVPNNAISIGFTAETNHQGAVIEGGKSFTKLLNVGNNVTTITVTAEDGITTKTYTITVIRANNNDQDEQTTGVDYISASELTIYPNPFAGELRINGVDTDTWRSASLRIINAAGAIVHAQTLVNNYEIINLEHLPAGVYIFRIEKDGYSQTIRVVKN